MSKSISIILPLTVVLFLGAQAQAHPTLQGTSIETRRDRLIPINLKTIPVRRLRAWSEESIAYHRALLVVAALIRFDRDRSFISPPPQAVGGSA
jgi:hypothetical protein